MIPKVGEGKKPKSFVVLLSREGEKAAEDLKRLASSAGIKDVPLTVHGDPAEAPDYELSKDADVTVVMWSGHKVKAARGFKGQLTEENIRDIMSDIPKDLGE